MILAENSSSGIVSNLDNFPFFSGIWEEAAESWLWNLLGPNKWYGNTYAFFVDVFEFVPYSPLVQD